MKNNPPPRPGHPIRRPTASDFVVAAIRRYLAAIDGDDFRPALISEALRLAQVLDSDRTADRLRYRAVTVELVEILGLLARERIIRTANGHAAESR